MTETMRKGWVMVHRKTGWIADFVFTDMRRMTINEMCHEFSGLTRRQVLRRYKPVKATMTIRLEDE